MGIENDHRRFEELQAFDDKVALDFDTQVVDNLDSVEDAGLPLISDDEKDIVPDSEDEGLRKVKSTRAIHVSSSADNSTPQHSYAGELSQSNALDFVDHFLATNEMGFSPVTEPRNTIRRTYSPVSSAKGAHSLAKGMKIRRNVGKIGIFEWDDSDQNKRVVDFYTKKMHASFDSGDYQQRSVMSYWSANHAGNRQSSKEVPAPSPSYIGAAVHCQRDTSRMEPVSEANNQNGSVQKPNQQLNAVSLEQELELGICEVGFDTQMAAEAMESLSSATLDAFQGPQNLVADSSRGLLKNKFHLGRSSLENAASTKLKGFAELPMQRMFPAGKGASGSPQNDFSHEELDGELAMIMRKKRKKGWNSTYKLESSTRESSRSTMQLKEEETDGRNNSKMCEGYASSLASLENVSLGNPRAEEELVPRHNVHCKIKEELGGSKDKLDAPRDRTTEHMKGSITTYRRKRNRVGAEPSKFLSARREYTKLCFNTVKEAENYRLGHQSKPLLEASPPISSVLYSSRWPKRKRTNRKLPTLFDGSCTSYTPLNAVDEKHPKRSFSKSLPRSCIVKELVRLDAIVSKSDLRLKDLRKRRYMAHVRVLFSQHLDNHIIKKQKKILAQLGMSTASCSRDATHFIADKFVRTSNMLEAIALGKPVVTHYWLQSCGEACCFIDEKNYILRDAKKEKEIGFNMAVSLVCAAQRPLLKGRRVFVTPKVKPNKETIISLVKSLQGQIAEKNQLDPLQIPGDLLILSCEEDHPICVPFLETGAAIYSSELLLNGIIIQKLEYERHRLFMKRIKKNRSKQK